MGAIAEGSLQSTWDRVEKERLWVQKALDEGTQIDVAAYREFIEQALAQLENQGEVDAAIQQRLNAITSELESKSITPCEAFARALQAIAEEVHRLVSNGDRVQEFLRYAWAYLVGPGLQVDPRFARAFDGRRKGHYHLTWCIPQWTTDKGAASQAVEGSGWVQPLPGDSDRSRRIAHLLANARLKSEHGLVADGLRAAWDKLDTSITDVEVNRLGALFGAWLQDAERTPEEIAEWIRKHACTERLQFALHWITNTVPAGSPRPTSWTPWNLVDTKNGTYHSVHFRLQGPVFAQPVEWDEWVFNEARGGLAISAFKTFPLSGEEFATRERAIVAAKEKSLLSFKTPPDP